MTDHPNTQSNLLLAYINTVFELLRLTFFFSSAITTTTSLKQPFETELAKCNLCFPQLSNSPQPRFSSISIPRSNNPSLPPPNQNHHHHTTCILQAATSSSLPPSSPPLATHRSHPPLTLSLKSLTASHKHPAVPPSSSTHFSLKPTPSAS